MAAGITYQQWQQVPERVRTLFPAAKALQILHNKTASETGILAIASASWHPEARVITIHTPAPLSARVKLAYVNTLNPGCSVVFAQTQPDIHAAIIVKEAAWAPGVGQAWTAANKALMGPTPLSNAVVSGLLLGGLGYGAGTLAENIFPERFVERGSLRKPLGIAGLLAGAGVGAMNAGETYRQLSKFDPEQTYLKSWVTSNNTPIPPTPQPPSVKASMFGGESNTNLRAPVIKVDAFNRAIWADASTGYNQTGIIAGHTSPPIAAATTGIINGIAAQSRSSIISPATVIHGLASAGVGLATANLAGRTLGALAGLTPGAQEKIQDAGLWAGMLHAVIPPLFGSR
jgi:hypothetical protein